MSLAEYPVTEVHQSQETFDPWRAYVVPAFPLDTLPPALRAFVEFQARNIGADPSAIAIASLVACSGAIDHQFALKMMEHGTWWTHPRLWALLVGAPSCKKTPVLSVALKPIRAAEQEHLRAHRKNQVAWQALKDAGEKPTAPSPPTRYILNDITSEKAGELLSQQNRGLLVEYDELAGFIGSMDKYSGGGKGAAADRGFWLQAYNGGPKNIDRIARGAIAIENCSVSFIGGIQPRRLAELGNLSSDGLLQRFLPVMMGPARLPEDISDDGAVEVYETLLAKLLKLHGCNQFLTPAAMAEVKEFQSFAYDVERIDGLGDSFCSFVGKLAGVHGSLSLVLHLAADPIDAPYEKVTEATVKAATRIIRDFVIPHAAALYQESTDKIDWDHLRAVASFVLTSQKERFTASDFTTNVRSMRGLGLWDVAQRVSPLVAGGWLTEDQDAAPAKAWTIISGVREHLSARRDRELDRKAEALQAIQTLRMGEAA